MPRKRRKKSKTDFYHVIVKGINGERIFNQQREKIYFKSIILKHLSKHSIDIYGYCIMSTHAHFIIRAEIKELSAFMSEVLSEYAIYYNYKHNRNGHVFQNRFQSECIEDERYFWTCLRYIHLNPVKAKMIKTIEKYKYSSILEYFTGNPLLISLDAIGLMEEHFGNTENFKAFHRQKMESMVLDVMPDFKLQQEEMALEMAKEIQIKNQFPLLCQVVEEKNTRRLFEKRLYDELKLSKRRNAEVCAMIKDKTEKLNNK